MEDQSTQTNYFWSVQTIVVAYRNPALYRPSAPNSRTEVQECTFLATSLFLLADRVAASIIRSHWAEPWAGTYKKLGNQKYESPLWEQDICSPNSVSTQTLILQISVKTGLTTKLFSQVDLASTAFHL
jgi:hypothetical protein